MAQPERQDVGFAFNGVFMQIEFLRDRARAQVGQKADSTPSVQVSSTASNNIPFGVLVVFDDNDSLLCQVPSSKEQLTKPLGISLRQLHALD